MSEEMNLYKRCKNIFKNHGVDMGGGGGESAPEVENAIETHGLGWTSKEETILVDNERVTTVVDDENGSCFGQFTTPFNIVDGAYTVIFNGTEYNLNSAFFEEGRFWYLGDVFESAPDFSRYPFVITSEDERTLLLTEFAGDYDVTIKTKLDTIHKIDEKYLPSGAFVINIDDDDWENKSTDPDFGLTVWKAFQSGKPIYIQRGEIPFIDCAVVSKVHIGRVCGPAMLTLYYTTSNFYYEPQDTYVPRMDTIMLFIDIDSITY